MIKNSQIIRAKSAFTLIEVLVASVILSSVFFAILTLISNNTHQATTLEHSKVMDSLFLSSRACIESFGYSNLVWMTTITQSIHFGADNLGCFTGSYSSNLSFTGISLKRISSTETGSTTFWSYFTVGTGTGVLQVNSTVSDGIESKAYNFLVGR